MCNKCDFCMKAGSSRYLYKSQVLKRIMKVTLCPECAEKEKDNVIEKISAKGV